MQNEMQVFSLFMQWKWMYEQMNEHWFFFFFTWSVMTTFIFYKRPGFLLLCVCKWSWANIDVCMMQDTWWHVKCMTWLHGMHHVTNAMQMIMGWYECMHDARYMMTCEMLDVSVIIPNTWIWMYECLIIMQTKMSYKP